MKTDDLLGRAIAWQEDDPNVLGIVVYGSVAQGRTHDLSDVDLVVVTAAARRDVVWSDRLMIATQLLDGAVAWSHELPWQGDYRYQAWRSDLLGVDLTFDEERIEPHEVFATGQPRIVAGDLTLPDLPRSDPVADAEQADGETWVWFLGIHNQLRQGRCWDAYVQFSALLDTRMARLLNQAELTELVPAGLEPEVLFRQLRRAVRAYDAARLAHGIESSVSPLADEIRAAILR